VAEFVLSERSEDAFAIAAPPVWRILREVDKGFNMVQRAFGIGVCDCRQAKILSVACCDLRITNANPLKRGPLVV
jgi:hypothetical protein